MCTDPLCRAAFSGITCRAACRCRTRRVRAEGRVYMGPTYHIVGSAFASGLGPLCAWTQACVACSPPVGVPGAGACRGGVATQTGQGPCSATGPLETGREMPSLVLASSGPLWGGRPLFAAAGPEPSLVSLALGHLWPCHCACLLRHALSRAFRHFDMLKLLPLPFGWSPGRGHQPRGSAK